MRQENYCKFTVDEENWIRENYFKYKTNPALFRAFQENFEYDKSFRWFESGLSNLNLHRTARTTPEIRAFIFENFSELGPKRMEQEIANRFGVNVSRANIQRYALKNGLRMANNSRSKLAQKVNQPWPVGSISFHKHYDKDGNVTRTSAMIRTENGWKPYGTALYEGPEENYISIPLDKNHYNLDPENWIIIPKRLTGMMAKLKLYSNDPELTKTGVAICELISAMKQKEKEVNIG